MSRVSIWSSTLATSVFLLIGCSGFEAYDYGFSGGTSFSGGNPNPTPTPTGNLLKNAGFESDFGDWEDWGSSTIITTANSGRKALRITGQGGSGQEVLHRLKTGGTYELRGFGRVSSATDSALIGIRFFDTGNATIADINQPVRATSFQNYTVRFTVPQRASSAKIYVWKESSSATTADFDDFSLTSMGPPANPPMLAAIGNPGGLQPAGAGNDWTLVFNDEFDGPNINPSVWNLGFGFSYTINNELQTYRMENVRTNEGRLSLLAERRNTTTVWGDPMSYASGAVTTRAKFTFTFGVVEARIRVPKGRGLAPAF